MVLHRFDVLIISKDKIRDLCELCGPSVDHGLFQGCDEGPASAPKSEGQEAENDDDPPGLRADDPPGAHVASWTPGLVQNVKVETT